jgi:hypothetical protein
MMIYCAARFKPKKKRKAKGVIAKKLNRASLILGTEELPSLSYGSRIGADQASKIRSLNTTASRTERKETMKYTGTLVKGLATMHKSNCIPVIDEEQMKEISRMRRG